MRILAPLRRIATAARPRYTGPAFIFDIDGVLLLSSSPLPAGRAALSALYNKREARWEAPVAFLTNGGGTTESARADALTAALGVPVAAAQVVLAHSPMSAYVARYNAAKDAAVAVVGPEGCADVARAYGFERVVELASVGQADPLATPFVTYRGPRLPPRERAAAGMPIAAVVCMADSRNWNRDLQLLCDLLASDGGPAAARRPAPLDAQPVDLYFSNPDLTFPNGYHTPRLAGGAFRVALEAVYRKVHPGRELRAVQWGKPHAPNYQHAEDALREQLAKMGYCDRSNLEAIYGIGDNHQSDIAGANRRGPPWQSVLVRTGNFTGDSDEAHEDRAHWIVDDAHVAVRTALERHASHPLSSQSE